MSNPEVAEGLKRLFNRRSKFILIGLTGRTGSGCTTAATLLSHSFAELRIPEPKRDNATSDDRKYRIVKDYAQKNWVPFFSISISNVILSYLLDHEEDELRKFFQSSNLLNNTNLDEFISSWTPAKNSWSLHQEFLQDRRATKEHREAFLSEWQGPIQGFFTTVRNGLGPASTKILQTVGDNIRKSGNPFESKYIP